MGDFDLGKLLRMQAMVRESIPANVTFYAAKALVQAYMSLRDELLSALDGELRAEFERMFVSIETPPDYNPRMVSHQEDEADLQVATSGAIVGLRKMGGWIQGLIDELTFDQRLQAEAQAKAEIEARPPTGFAA